VEPHLHVQTINSFSIQDSLIFIITLFYNPSPSTSGTFLSKLLQMQQHQQQQLLPQVPTGESASYQPILTASQSLRVHHHPSDNGPRVSGLFLSAPGCPARNRITMDGISWPPTKSTRCLFFEQLFQAQGSYPHLAAFNHILRQEQQQVSFFLCTS
jgi:hypothetical protein